MSKPVVISGRAYQRNATLEIDGGMLTWRAQKPLSAENIITTVDDVTDVMWLERRGTLAGAAVAVAGVVAIAYDYLVPGIVLAAIAVAMIVHRIARPVRLLGLGLPGRWLVMQVDRDSVDAARALAGTLEKKLLPSSS